MQQNVVTSVCESKKKNFCIHIGLLICIFIWVRGVRGRTDLRFIRRCYKMLHRAQCAHIEVIWCQLHSPPVTPFSTTPAGCYLSMRRNELTFGTFLLGYSFHPGLGMVV